ncbi:MAG: LamG domain-containing protein, partial [Proteobacteria bacterium]|nr:LamG domain-containing protein [Pseudomonadota bacterium]
VYVDDGVSNTLSAGFACSGSNTFSYTSAATSADGTYKFTLYQENTSTGIVSASTVFTWVRDTSAPSAPTVTTPSVSPYTSGGNLSLSGGCENNATVNLSGASTQSTVCSNNSYAFLVIQSVDSTYNFALSQTDRAGNVSTSISRQWIRSTAVDPAPTITSPSVSPYSSKDRTLILAGGCITGRTVTLGGAGVTASDVVNPAGSLAQACVSSAYSFTISKSTDGTFALALVQGNSNSAGLNWTVDSVAPNTTLTSTPAATNLQSDSVFTFSSDDATATFQCSLDSAPFSTCLSGVKYALTNGTHSLSVRAVDALGNFDPSPASYTWTQSAYKTIALYHFNTGVPFADSGTPSWNNLTNNSTTDYVSGKFGYAREFASVTGSSPPRNLSAPHSQSLGLLRSTFSAEAWVKLSSLPGSNDAVVISKMGAGGQFGWELGFYKSGSKYYVYADLSGNGTSNSTAKSVLSATEVSGLTSGWNHVALTFDSGAVRIFFNGVQKVSSTLRFATVFDNSSTPFVIGAANGQNGLLGWIDEVRLSQIVRWTANFNPSAMFEYSPD